MTPLTSPSSHAQVRFCCCESSGRTAHPPQPPFPSAWSGPGGGVMQGRAAGGRAPNRSASSETAPRGLGGPLAQGGWNPTALH